MLAFAPRIPQKLLEAIVALDDRTVPIAEISRRVGRKAWELGLPKPSYQRVRELIHQARRLRLRRPTTTSVLLDVCFRIRPPEHLLDALAGDAKPLPP